MSDSAADPLTRALATFQHLCAPKTDPVSLAFWDKTHSALLAAQPERQARLAVAEEARSLVDAVDDYEDALEAKKVRALEKLGDTCVEAEDALVDSLNYLHAVQHGHNEETIQ